MILLVTNVNCGKLSVGKVLCPDELHAFVDLGVIYLVLITPLSMIYRYI